MLQGVVCLNLPHQVRACEARLECPLGEIQRRTSTSELPGKPLQECPEGWELSVQAHLLQYSP